LLVRFYLTARDGSVPDAPPARIDVDFLGSLSGGPFAPCLAERIAEVVQAPPLPAAVSGATLYRRYDLAPAAAPCSA
jgi:hypothetical protein